MFSNSKISRVFKQILRNSVHPDQYGSVDQALYRKAKIHWFDFWSGHVPGLWVGSPVRMHMRGNELMFLSHIYMSLFLFLFPFPSFSK